VVFPVCRVRRDRLALSAYELTGQLCAPAPSPSSVPRQKNSRRKKAPGDVAAAAAAAAAADASTVVGSLAMFALPAGVEVAMDESILQVGPGRYCLPCQMIA